MHGVSPDKMLLRFGEQSPYLYARLGEELGFGSSGLVCRVEFIGSIKACRPVVIRRQEQALEEKYACVLTSRQQVDPTQRYVCKVAGEKQLHETDKNKFKEVFVAGSIGFGWAYDSVTALNLAQRDLVEEGREQNAEAQNFKQASPQYATQIARLVGRPYRVDKRTKTMPRCGIFYSYYSRNGPDSLEECKSEGEGGDPDERVTIHECSVGRQQGILQPLLPGQNLYELLTWGGLRFNGLLGRALVLAKEVVEQVMAAHGRGVLHLDLKPGNIHVRNTRETYLCDFGHARRIGENTVLFGRPRQPNPYFSADRFTDDPEKEYDAIPAKKWHDEYALAEIIKEVLQAVALHPKAHVAQAIVQVFLNAVALMRSAESGELLEGERFDLPCLYELLTRASELMTRASGVSEQELTQFEERAIFQSAQHVVEAMVVNDDYRKVDLASARDRVSGVAILGSSSSATFLPVQTAGDRMARAQSMVL